MLDEVGRKGGGVGRCWMKSGEGGGGGIGRWWPRVEVGEKDRETA